MRVLLPMLLALAGIASATPEQCAALQGTDVKRLPNATTVVSSATWKPASAAQRNAPALPEHCEVLGRLNDREGANGQHYAIKFHLRLPAQWNGGFFFEGGGGSNGNLGNAYGNLQGQQRTNALSLGYAVVSQDSGHDNAVNNDPQRNATQTFGFDPQARLDFGYNSYDQVTQTAKALIQVYYGQAPRRSYYVGCSEGGREAMMMSQRFPADYDGILACSPGFQLSKAAVFGESQAAQAYGELAKSMGIYDKNGQPLLNKTFTDEDLDIVVSAILSACDALDGLADGIIEDFPHCTTETVSSKLAAITCKGPKRNSCLSAAQIEALTKVMDGAKNSKGELLYGNWAWDRGLGGKNGDSFYQGWRAWKIGPYDAPQNSAISANLGGFAVSAIFTTPPTVVPAGGGIAHLLGVDFDRDAAKVTATSGDYKQSAWDFMMASSTDLSAFKNRGGKLIIVHGVSDPIFSVQEIAKWWTQLNSVDKTAADFARFFAVPGMNHCSGGPATDQFDAFGALVAWVEKNTAPDQIIATAGPTSPWPNRTRPLCVYPRQARYKGSGSIEDANNFACRLP